MQGDDAGAPSTMCLDPTEIKTQLCLPWVVWNGAFLPQGSQQIKTHTNGECLGPALPARLFPAWILRRNLHKFLWRQEH